MPILIGVLGFLGILFYSQRASGGVLNMSNKRLFDLEDIDPSEQGGGYKKDFDLFFEASADKYGVPFSLLKAHALMESSLNPKAYRDENPQKKESRKGWASRGLMQLLFWPGSTRFEKYGYDADSLDQGEELYEPYINIDIAAQLIRQNLNDCKGNLRDAINMYNAGVKESVRKAPENYVDRVLTFRNKILNKG